MLTALAAVSLSWGIGREGRLLFSLPGDLRRFRALTLGGTLIMGRKTLDSLPGGRPLPGRRCVVFSRNPAFRREGVCVVHEASALLPLLSTLPAPHCLIGGGELFAQLLPLCGAAELTQVQAEAEADCFFPPLDRLADWQLKTQSPLICEGGLSYRFCRWERG